MSTSNPSGPRRLRHSDLAEWLPALAPGLRFGVTRLTTPISIALYDEWIKEGRHGEMEYLARHRDKKADPQKWLPFAQSAIVMAIDYVTGAIDRKRGLRTALYTEFANDQVDYHTEIRRRLEPVLAKLKENYPDATFRIGLDAEPVLERDLAVRAGLGWIGKNTCLIDRNHGSLFFIAEILTSIPIDDSNHAAVQSPDHCGTCTRCIDACPTEAIVAPRKLDARKCISYWTIESQSIPDKELRSKFGDWFFGCDICQTVCPWNGKVFGHEKLQSASVQVRNGDRKQTILELRGILNGSNRELTRRFKNTPLERARGFGLKRNAMIIASNLGLSELRAEIETYVGDPKLGPLALDVLKGFGP